MAVFGISHTVNTKVGNDFVRGVSGGERKRVSIAEVTLNQSPIQCWDNSTRGLDSATALEFTRTLKLSTEMAGTSAIVAMYQGSQPSYDIFDKVAVLYEGRQIYFGPASLAKRYFLELGYHCPERQTTADFLTSLTNPAERIPQVGAENRVPKSPDEFAEAWENSLARADLMREIASFEAKYPLDGKAIDKFVATRKIQQSSLMRPKSPYTISVPMQIWLCMTRGYQRLLAEKLFFLVTVAGNAVISLVLGSVFYQLPSTADSINNRAILLFFAILFNGLSSALEIIALYVQRPIVEKHNRYALYHPFSEAVSSVICDLPSKILSTVAFNVPLYFMANLRQEASAFFTFLLFGFTCTLTMSMILRTIGQTSRTIHQALTPAAIFILGLIIYTGFVLPTRMMQNWLRWLNYLNPIGYAFEAIMANEFTNRQFPCPSFVPAYPDASPSEHGSFFIDANYEYLESHIWRNFGILIAYILFFLVTYILAAEFLSMDGSKGEILVFQRGNNPQKATRPMAADEESGNIAAGNHSETAGASGAGKTTLLNVLANRVTMGVVSGDISVNGISRDKSFQRKTGYVQQQDIHLATSTVREALRFSAMLRQPSNVSKSQKYASVEETIKLLEMEAYADAIVGVPGEGLNVEQRKRLTIGVELAAKPDLLLFLDEPTSGLDSQTAWSIASLIRKLSDNGQAILCTIHQPSAILFQQFDRMLLLAAGGKTVYFGDLGQNAQLLIDYFERHGTRPCSVHENPAEWMLEVIGAAPGSKTDRNWALTWIESPELEGVHRELAELSGPHSSHSDTEEENTDTYANSFITQMTALFIGVSFYDAELSMQGLQNQMFSLFMLLLVFAFLVYQSMPHFILQRELYEARERASRTYSWIVFMLVNVIVELPWNSLAGLLIYLTFYYLVGMHRNAEPTDSVTERGGLMFLFLWAFMLFESTFATMVVAGVEMAEVGATIALLLFTFTLIFCGVIVPMDSLPGFWKFMYRVSPLTYLVSGLLSTGLAHNAVQCSELELLRFAPANGTSCEEYLAPYQEMTGGQVIDGAATDMCEFCPLATTDAFLATINSDYGERWRNYGLMWVYIVFNVAAALLLYWLMRVPKGWSWRSLVTGRREKVKKPGQ
ncbi:hypothetical protein ACHAQH_007312 [Verticillium albo-atrum]